MIKFIKSNDFFCKGMIIDGLSDENEARYVQSGDAVYYRSSRKLIDITNYLMAEKGVFAYEEE